MSQSTSIALARLGLLVLIITIWQWGWNLQAYGWPIPTFLDPYFVSKPSIIWARFLEMGCFVSPKSREWTFFGTGAFLDCLWAPRGNLWVNTWVTLQNTFWGFVIGVAGGMVAGLILGRSEFLAKIFEPYIIAVNSLPRVALVPLIIILFGIGDMSKIVTALMLVFFVVFFNTYEGTRSVDRDHINAARFLGANNWQILWTVHVPSALTWVFTSLTPAISFALVGVIVGEFIGAQRGLGKVIIDAEATLQIADMMVALLMLMVIGAALVVIVRALQKRLLRWQRHNIDAF